MSIGYIYKISSPSTEKIYIGSTTTTLQERFNAHNKTKKDCSSAQILKFGDAEIELLEELEYNDKIELLWKEREYQEQFRESCVNKFIAIRTDDEVKKYQKEYRKKNREKAKEYGKQYYRKNKIKPPPPAPHL